MQKLTFKSVVQLSGFANSESEIDKTVDAVSEINGVKSVKNDMHLKK